MWGSSGQWCGTKAVNNVRAQNNRLCCLGSRLQGQRSRPMRQTLQGQRETEANKRENVDF